MGLAETERDRFVAVLTGMNATRAISVEVDSARDPIAAHGAENGIKGLSSILCW